MDFAAVDAACYGEKILYLKNIIVVEEKDVSGSSQRGKSSLFYLHRLLFLVGVKHTEDKEQSFMTVKPAIKDNQHN